jgi:opacity protein-like surface antigen
LLGGLRAEWVLEANGPLALAATADILPLVLVTHNPTYRDEEVLQPDGSLRRVKTETGRALVYGAGLSPFGLQAYLAQVRGARVFGGGAVGALWFTRDTPVPDSRRFNLTFEYGGGVELPISETRTVVAGYKFHHFSNAYTAPRNPGVDGNVLYLGVMRRR